MLFQADLFALSDSPRSTMIDAFGGSADVETVDGRFIRVRDLTDADIKGYRVNYIHLADDNWTRADKIALF